MATKSALNEASGAFDLAFSPLSPSLLSPRAKGSPSLTIKEEGQRLTLVKGARSRPALREPFDESRSLAAHLDPDIFNPSPPRWLVFVLVSFLSHLGLILWLGTFSFGTLGFNSLNLTTYQVSLVSLTEPGARDLGALGGPKLKAKGSADQEESLRSAAEPAADLNEPEEASLISNSEPPLALIPPELTTLKGINQEVALNAPSPLEPKVAPPTSTPKVKARALRPPKRPQTNKGQERPKTPKSAALKTSAEATGPALSSSNQKGLSDPSSLSLGGVSGGGVSGGEEGYAAANYNYIKNRIRRFLVYNPKAKRMGVTGTTTVAFTIAASGAALDVSVRQTSGHDGLDDSAVAAVKAASPFPPPPSPARVVVPVAFNLR